MNRWTFSNNSLSLFERPAGGSRGSRYKNFSYISRECFLVFNFKRFYAKVIMGRGSERARCMYVRAAVGDVFSLYARFETCR